MKNRCKFGHTFYEYGDCPICELLKKPNSSFLSSLSNPARNALIHHDIDTVQKLANYKEKEILKIHGVGKASLPMLKKSLEENGLTFKPNE